MDSTEKEIIDEEKTNIIITHCNVNIIHNHHHNNIKVKKENIMMKIMIKIFLTNKKKKNKKKPKTSFSRCSKTAIHQEKILSFMERFHQRMELNCIYSSKEIVQYSLETQFHLTNATETKGKSFGRM